MLVQWVIVVVIQLTFWKFALAGLYEQRDMLFIVDGHTGVAAGDFVVQGHFAANIADSLLLGECTNKAALMQYGDRIIVHWDLNSPEASYSDIFNNGVSSIKQIGGPMTTFTSVLNKARKFFKKGGGRKGVVKHVILINSGKAKQGGNLKAAAKKLNKIAKITVILVGAESDFAAARQITAEENIFSITNFGEIVDFVTAIFTVARECDSKCEQGFENKAVGVELEQSLFRTFSAKLSNGAEKAADLSNAPLKVTEKKQFCVETLNLRKFYVNSVCLDTTNIREVTITGTNQSGGNVFIKTQEVTSDLCHELPVSLEDLQLVTRLCFSFVPTEGQGQNMKTTPVDIDTCLQK